MIRLFSTLPILLVSATMAFTELPDSSGRVTGQDSLARKVDSLEAGMTRLRFEMEDRSPYVNGSALKWGRGLGAELRLHQLGLDAGLRYTFRNGTEPQASPGLYTYTRWSLLAGAKSVSDQNIPKHNRYTPGDATFAGYVGWRMASPIFLNFMSTEFGHDLFWSDPSSSWQPGWSQTLEIQFWMSKIGHFNVGNVSNMESRHEENRVDDIFRPYMGFTFSLFQPRDKSALTAK